MVLNIENLMLNIDHVALGCTVFVFTGFLQGRRQELLQTDCGILFIPFCTCFESHSCVKSAFSQFGCRLPFVDGTQGSKVSRAQILNRTSVSEGYHFSCGASVHTGSISTHSGMVIFPGICPFLFSLFCDPAPSQIWTNPHRAQDSADYGR